MNCLLHDLDSANREDMPLNPSERNWIQKEITDQLRDVNRESTTALHQLENTVASINGRLSVPSKAPHPYLVPVIGCAGVLIAAFWTWVGITLVQHGNSLVSIKQSLLGLGITTSANTPGEPDSQAQA